MAEPVPDQQEQSPRALAELTADIVSAYVGNHTVALSDLGTLITTTAQELNALNQSPTDAPVKPEPAVPIKKSIHHDHIFCLICGQPQKMLKRHLATRHDLVPDDYRAMFGLKEDYPIVAPSYAAIRSDLAKKAGLGRKPEPITVKPEKKWPIRKAATKPRKKQTA